MGKRNKFAGGEYSDGMGGSHGHYHGEYGHFSTPVWRGRHSEFVARQHREETDRWRRSVRRLGLSGGNRKKGPRRRP